MSQPTQIEKESLEAHVELCAVRYNNLEHALSNLELRMDKFELHLIEIKASLATKEAASIKQTIGIFTTIVGALLAGLIGFIAKGIFRQ